MSDNALSLSASGLMLDDANSISANLNTISLDFQITSLAVDAANKLFNESTNKSLKTPISLLQEICSKSQCAPPSYELLAAEGQMHQPIFVYKCILNNFYQAIAKGNSKKKAKHCAALAVLIQIKQSNIGVNDSLAQKMEFLIQSINDLDMEETPSAILNETELEITKPKLDGLSNGIKTEQDILTNLPSTNSISAQNLDQIKASLVICENPVGELIEIAQRFSMRPPEFEHGEEDGPPHNRQFSCVAVFGEYRETGLGRAKKLAKRQAAIKLLFKLKSSGKFKTPVQKRKDTSLDETSSARNGHAKKNSINIFNQFKTSKNLAINQLLNSDSEISFKEMNKSFLDKIAQEEKFEYTIFKLPSRLNGRRDVMIDLKTVPHVVVGGYGSTDEEAVNTATYYALNHIKLMCSKGASS